MSITRRAFLIAALGAYPALGVRGAQKPTTGPRGPFRVAVIGGGYGGVTAARYLKLAAPQLEVTLIHRDSPYRSCPGANEVIAGVQPSSSLVRPYDQLSSRYGIRLRHGEVTSIDGAKGLATLRGGISVPFDRAVVAPGIGFRWDAWEGYDEAASVAVPHAWHAGAQVDLIRRQLRRLRPGGVVVIVAPPDPYRCPPGPYERASLMAYYLKQHNPRAKVVIVDSKTRFSKQGLFQKGWDELYPGMIEWVSASEEGGVERIDSRNRMVVTEFGKHRGDLLNVIPPQKAGDLAEKVGLSDGSGWCPVDPRTFESTRVPNIHVIGDACIASPMPKSAFSANSQAKVCAAAIADLADGRAPGLPSLINHCYSFLAPDYAISITGVYEFSSTENALFATSTGETPIDADRRVEARQARAWQKNFRYDVFG